MPTTREIKDLARDWPVLWQLIFEADAFHAEQAGARLRQNREKSAYNKFSTALEADSGIVVLAEEEGSALGIGFAQLLAADSEQASEVGFRSDFYVRPGQRGGAAGVKILRHVEDRLRSRGVRHSTGMVFAANERSVRLWARLGFVETTQVLRKMAVHLAPKPSQAPPGLELRRIDDPMAEWSAIWPRLQHRDAGPSAGRSGLLAASPEEAHKRRIQSMVESKSRLVLAEFEGDLAGLIFARISKNPWLVEERVGFIEDYSVSGAPGLDFLPGNLIRHAEAWFLAKGVDAVQHTATSEAAGFWRSRGYAPFFLGGQKQL